MGIEPEPSVPLSGAVTGSQGTRDETTGDVAHVGRGPRRIRAPRDRDGAPRGRAGGGLVVGGALTAVLLVACPSGESPVVDDDGAGSTTGSGPITDGGPTPDPGATSSSLPGSTSGGSTSADPDTATTIEPPKLDLAPIPDAPEGTDGTTGEPVDCEGLAPLPASFVTVTGPTSSEDFVFDPDGHLLNVANAGDLLQADYGASSTLVYPGVGSGFAAGTAMRSNGDVVFNSGGQVRRVATDGSVEVIAAGLSYPNGLAVGIDDLVYVAEQSGGRVVVIDPDTLSVDVVAQGLPSPNGLAFDRSYENLYVGSFGGGTVHQIHIPTGTVQVYASSIGTGSLDGIVVDACDNVYVTDFGPGIVYRVEGLNHELVANLPAGWIPNMHFGSGVGGWDSWRLYVMNISGNQLYEVDLGVPGIPLPQL